MVEAVEVATVAATAIAVVMAASRGNRVFIFMVLVNGVFIILQILFGLYDILN